MVDFNAGGNCVTFLPHEKKKTTKATIGPRREKQTMGGGWRGGGPSGGPQPNAGLFHATHLSFPPRRNVARTATHDRQLGGG